MSHYVHTTRNNMDILSCIYDPNGNTLSYAQLCDLINVLQDDCQTMKNVLGNIVELRNEFDGPSLDYMQGYRDGQQYLQEIAKLGLSSL